MTDRDQSTQSTQSADSTTSDIDTNESIPEVSWEDSSAGLTSPLEVRCKFVSGSAGTGKTFQQRELIRENPDYGILCASTGIAAANLGAVTVNSLLGYFDTASLRDSYLQGWLGAKLRRLATEARNIILDELSMLDGVALDYLHRALKEVNGNENVIEAGGLGLILVGDFAQLPPVKAKWAFDAECWPEFDANTVRLTKNWRQTQGGSATQEGFLMALQAARRGDGGEAARLLTECGLRWETALETEFDGTTIVPKNDQVDRYNAEALSRVQGKKVVVRASRWGKQRGDWKQVPEVAEFKLGCYVMLLANKMQEGLLIYANGDCGHIADWDGTNFFVELVRNKEVVCVEPVTRNLAHREKPDGWAGRHENVLEEWYPALHRKGGRKKEYVEGQVKFHPLRLAYASTVHRSQGLSLDKVQFDFRNPFAAQPAMLYVAMSRARTLEGLRLVGMRDKFVKACNTDARVKRWL